SPVTTLSPGPNSSVASSITPSDEIRSSSSIVAWTFAAPAPPSVLGAAPAADREAELRDQTVGERRRPKRGQPDRPVAPGRLHARPRGQVEGTTAVAPQDA